MEITKAAAKAIKGIAEPYRSRIAAAIVALADNPRPEGCTSTDRYDALMERLEPAWSRPCGR